MNSSILGINCPMCTHAENKVVQTRRNIGKVIRWRRCLNCDYLYKTNEITIDEPKVNEKGLVCSKCGCAESIVYATSKRNWRITRYRKCTNCGHSFKTEEKSDMNPILFIKNGEKEYPLFLKTLNNSLECSKKFKKKSNEVNMLKEIIEIYFKDYKPDIKTKACVPIIANEEAFNVIFSALYAINETRAAIYCKTESYMIKKRKKVRLYDTLTSNKDLIKIMTKISKSIMRVNTKTKDES